MSVTSPLPGQTVARRTAIASLLALLLATFGLLTSPSATAAVGQQYRFNTSATGESLRFTGQSAAVANRVTTFSGFSSGASGFAGYALTTTGTWPTTDGVTYTEADFDVAPLTPDALAQRGAVEWIVKNGYNRTTANESALRAAITTATGTNPGSLSISNAIAGTQAAIWHVTQGLDLDPSTAVNNSQIRAIYNFLVAGAQDREATIVTAPTLDVAGLNGRTAYAITPGTAFGPFTVTGSTAATLSLSPAASARIVDAAGTPLTGAQDPGTSFYIEPTATPAVDGAVAITAQGTSVTGTVLNIVASPAASPRRPHTRLATVSFPATSASLNVTWAIDRNAAGSFDPDGDATSRTYNYTPRGEQSATLERLTWTDGTSTTVDLIGLTGEGSTASANVYAADRDATSYGALGPILPSGTTYTEVAWEEGRNAQAHPLAPEVTWLLSNSYPQRTVAQLTADARAAGVDPATGNVKIWSAIAATQAAIWHYTSGSELDVTRYADPTAALASSTADGDDAAALVDGSGAGWRAGAPGEATIDLTFPAPVEIRSYALTSRAGGAQANTPAAWRLQRSVDGQAWSDVSTSGASHTFTGGAAQTRSTTLGASATYGGYSHFRLVLTGAADPASPVEIGGIRIEGFGVFGSQPNLQLREFANESEVVHLYNYLLAGAEAGSVTPPVWSVELTAPESTFLRENTTDVVGPLTYEGDSSARVSATGADGVKLLATHDGALQDELVLSPGETFWLFPGENEEAEIELSALGSAQNWVSARALNGTHRASGNTTLTLTQLGIASRAASTTLTVTVAPVPDPTLDLSVAEGYAGDVVTVTGTGFGALEDVVLALHSDPIALTTVAADDGGAFVVDVTVPDEADLGDHTVRALGARTSRSAGAPFTVLETVVEPGDGESTDPGDGESTDPEDGESTDPEDGEKSTPASTPSSASASPTATTTATTSASPTTGADLPGTGSSTSGTAAALAALAVLVGVGVLVARRVRLT